MPPFWEQIHLQNQCGSMRVYVKCENALQQRIYLISLKKQTIL